MNIRRPVVILVCGVQGSGKSWVCRQLASRFDYVAHDRCWSHPSAVPDAGLDPKWGPPGSVSTHLAEVVKAAEKAVRLVITEAPFGESALKMQLEAAGLEVIPVFVDEDIATIQKRYLKREGKPLPAGVASRAAGIAQKAASWGAFSGTSAALLRHLASTRFR